MARCRRFGQAVPAEDPQAQEGRLEEEGQQALHRQRGAEDVADEAGVLGPVHAELELLHDAGHDTHGEVDQEELPEELGQLEVLDVARPVPGRLEARHQPDRAEGQGDEQEVVDGRDAELPLGELERTHGRCPSSSVAVRQTCDAGTRAPACWVGFFSSRAGI